MYTHIYTQCSALKERVIMRSMTSFIEMNVIELTEITGTKKIITGLVFMSNLSNAKNIVTDARTVFS